jgi:microcystin degradation protein MlrC
MLLRATALPGGSVVASAYRAHKQALLDALAEVLPVDAVYLDLHGAMHVEGMEDAEADLVEAVRACVGPDCMLGASTDLHGNISARLVGLLDLITTYRTAPHLDEVETRAKACRLILRALAERTRPVRAWVGIPALLPGERTSTCFDPARSLYRRLPELETDPAVWDASLWVGYAWADEPRAGSSVVVTGSNPARAAACAVDVAQRYWDARKGFLFGVPSGTADQCLDWALHDGERPVLISDSGDNPTAGGAGDVPGLLAQLLARPAFRSGGTTAIFAAIADEAASAALHQAGEGRRVTVTLGGRLDPRHGSPLTVTGRVQRLLPGTALAGAQAVLAVDQVHVIVTARRQPYHHLDDFRSLGLDPTRTDITVVKMGYLVPELDACARRAYLALTPGAVDQDIVRLGYRAVRRPIFPLDPEMVWHPEPVVFGS